MLTQKSLKLVSDRQYMVDVLMDDKTYADKVLKGGNVVNVITREIYEADIALSGQYILMVGNCEGLIGPNTQVFDMKGKYLTPGFIDSHMHFESAMLTASEFSRISIPTGTTCLISDPHEIGNVLGPIGIKAMAEEVKTLPNHVYLRVPALTPDSPGLETAGYDVTSCDIPELLSYPSVLGIGETQGVSAAKWVYKHNPAVFRDTIISTVYARENGFGVDGNAPELFQNELAAHIIAGGCDVSCHETTSKAEAVEKLRYGVYMLMREGSTQRNMPECIRAVTEEGLDSRRAILATDDMLAEDIVSKGHMNDIIRRTIKEGVDPVEAIQMATINASTWLNLPEIGVLAPGKMGDIAVIDSPLEDMNVSSVFLKGDLAAKDGKLLLNIPEYTYPDEVKNSVNRGVIKVEDLLVKASGDKAKVRCIGLILDQNLTEAFEEELDVVDGVISPDVDRDILPIAVIGRYGQVDIGSAFVKGFNMKQGAFAETVSHDTHNIIVVGTNYEDMVVAVNRVIEMRGGVAVAKGGSIIDEIPLRIAGLMTDELNAYELTDKMIKLHETVKVDLECKAHAPFMHLAFLSLTTSPKWKITDKGIVDANNYCTLPVVID
ncbi:MAG: adenine deaminase C-terminal domain-containing protein [Clostridium sp.]|uniref:adenine deaminase n=3 Tax=Clostridium sp. TaxID=1506 RepID=UPI002FC6B589